MELKLTGYVVHICMYLVYQRHKTPPNYCEVIQHFVKYILAQCARALILNFIVLTKQNMSNAFNYPM